MINTLKIFLFSIQSLLYINCKVKTDKTPYEIIILAGQSNTHAGIGIDKTIDITNGNIFQLSRFSNYNHTITPANEPLDNHTINKNKIGFGLSFSKLYDKNNNNNNPIIIIPCGYSGTSITQHWYKGSFLYQDLIDRTKFILEKFPNSQLKLVLWHQGESDDGNPNYDTLLDSFIQNIRNDLNKENLPFIVGGMVPFWVSKSESRINQQKIIKETPLRVKNTAYADPEIPFIIEKEDNNFDEVHYNAEGQRELGKRYFNAYLSLTKEQSKTEIH